MRHGTRVGDDSFRARFIGLSPNQALGFCRFQLEHLERFLPARPVFGQRLVNEPPDHDLPQVV
jgi:hypothetical protein